MVHETVTRPVPPAIPRPQTRPWTLALLVLALGLVYAYGWRVTQIDIGQLVTNAHLIRPLVRDLIRPDVLAWVPRTQVATAPFSYSAEGAPAQAPPASGPRLALSSPVAQPGKTLEIRGQGFAPNRPGRLIWIDQAGATAQGP
ncbi:MAG: hypothetical protein RB148_06350, partial [Armatimonadota bacterium]|nr:hypothetical protein [Armatimonadota bacterium]